MNTVDGFIFVGTKFRGLNKNDTFMGFKIRGHYIFFYNSYRKLPFRGYWNLWTGHSTNTTKIGTRRNLSHPQYYDAMFRAHHPATKKRAIFHKKTDNIGLTFQIQVAKWLYIDKIKTSSYKIILKQVHFL